MYRLTALLPCFSKTLETNPQACTPRAVSGSNAPTWMERTLVVERLPSHYTRSYVFAWSAVHFRLVLRKHVNIFFDQNKSLIGAVWLFMSTAIVIRTAPGAQILCSAMYWFTQLPMGYPCHIAFKNLTFNTGLSRAFVVSDKFRFLGDRIGRSNRQTESMLWHLRVADIHVWSLTFTMIYPFIPQLWRYLGFSAFWFCVVGIPEAGMYHGKGSVYYLFTTEFISTYLLRYSGKFWN